ncbi:medium-chain acyl-CoA ligase ACSF2, mitochondrial-like [Phlebotomus argentipes]|uniref:medium-chain acyl-CoA ligase ACSF2, mitochondrial-like n=1 Tax=Phlebotomus argentipes TaxID=94469 RepID=UPI00289377AA|nr:medium-chain acyl-CoA ligase ACSF2, mitochondrial-like [Phlebotomus argentipes]
MQNFITNIKSTAGFLNQVNKLSYIHNIGKFPLVYRNIGQELGRVASEFGDREAFVAVEEQKRLTYDQLRCEADRLAAGFLSLGLKQGDRLGLWAPNVIAWPVVFFAAARAGLILVALNPAYEPPEMEYCLQKVSVKALVTTESFRNKPYYDSLQKIIPELQASSPGRVSCERIPSLSHIIMDTQKDLDGVFRLCDVSAMPTGDQVQEIPQLQSTINPDSGCNIQFTSGTTGKPKAALLRHSSFVNNGMHIGDHLELQERRICMQVPFFHVYGVVITTMASLSHRATIVLPSITYNPEKSLHAIQQEKCSVINGTPTMHVDLVRKQKELQLDLEAEIAVSGGALCPPQLLRDMKSELGLKKVKSVYGLTENSSVSFSSLPGDDEDKVLSTVGHMLDHTEAKVVDSEGHLVPFGAPGELCVRGYYTMLGYWEDEAKTKEVLSSDGWLKTGDQFVLHEDGYGKVVGRLKDMIIRGGENIFPKEVEDILVTNPKIAEAYVVGVPDERLGEELCAFIRLQAGLDDCPSEEIREFCRGKISYFKIPRYFRIVTEFPKTLSGKIQKFKLQEQFRNEGKINS